MSGAAAPPPTPSRLSHLSTTILTSVLELQRLHSLSVAAPPALLATLHKNLAQLTAGIDVLDRADASTVDRTLVDGLKAQEQRIFGLVKGLGIEVRESEQRAQAASGNGKTGRLVDAGDDDDDAYVDPFQLGEDAVPLQSVNSPHVSIPTTTTASARDRDPQRAYRELDVMEEDEEAMRRANSEVVQMQQRILEDQDEQLDSLSSAISRQHALSLRVAEELELHSSLLDDTEAAVDRTDVNLRRASSRLDRFAEKAKNTGSTGVIVALIVVLVVLILVFKL
ncbi:hypothetical protein JCM10212_001270 [Sporobolomyces blumeae]